MPDRFKDVLARKDKADIPFRKYSLLKGEIHLQIRYFKNHVKNFQLISSPILAGASYLLVNPQFTPANDNKFVWITVLYIVITATCYLIYDITDASYQILTLAERLAMIERKINAIAGEKLLIWESEISERFNAGMHPFAGVLHPLWCMRFYSLALLVALLIGIPLWASWMLWGVATTHVVLTQVLITGLAFYSIGSSVLAFMVVRGVEKNLRIEARKVLDESRSGP